MVKLVHSKNAEEFKQDFMSYHGLYQALEGVGSKVKIDIKIDPTTL
jgi:hypothetical protein